MYVLIACKRQLHHLHERQVPSRFIVMGKWSCHKPFVQVHGKPSPMSILICPSVLLCMPHVSVRCVFACTKARSRVGDS